MACKLITGESYNFQQNININGLELIDDKSIEKAEKHFANQEKDLLSSTDYAEKQVFDWLANELKRILGEIATNAYIKNFLLTEQ